MKRKLLAILLALCLIVGMLPLSALAVDNGDGPCVGEETLATYAGKTTGLTYDAVTHTLTVSSDVTISDGITLWGPSSNYPLIVTSNNGSTLTLGSLAYRNSGCPVNLQGNVNFTMNSGLYGGDPVLTTADGYAGNITISSNSSIASGNLIPALTTTGDITLSGYGTLLEGGGAMCTLTCRNITITGNGGSIFKSPYTIDATGDVTLRNNNGGIASGASITITKAASLTMEGTSGVLFQNCIPTIGNVTGNVSIRNTGGSIYTFGSSLSIGNVGGDLTIEGSGTLFTAGGITTGDVTGAVSITSTGAIAAGGGITVPKAASVTISGNSSSLFSGGSISLGTVTGAVSITNTGGSIASGGGLSLTSASSLTATGKSSTNPLFTGDIVAGVSGAVTLTNETGAVGKTAITGAASVGITGGCGSASLLGSGSSFTNCTTVTITDDGVSSAAPNDYGATITGGTGKVENITLKLKNSESGYDEYTLVKSDSQYTLPPKNDAGVTLSGVPTSAKTYGDDDFTLTATAENEGENGAWTWTSSDSDVLTVTNAGVVTIVGVGSATITAAYESDTTMGSATSASITVGKATVTVAAGTYKVSKTYDGGTTAGAGSGSLSVSGVLSTDTGVTVTPTIPAFSSANAGTGNLTVTLALGGAGSGNYQLASSSLSVPYEITKKSITPTVENIAAVDYDGTAKTPAVVVKDGSTILASTDYEVTYSNNTNAGTATATVKAKSTGNYSFSDTTKDFTINKIAYSGSAITASKSVLVNKAQTGVEVDFTGAISDITGATVASAAKGADTENLISNVSTNGNKVTFDVASVADAGKSATINVTITSTNYTDITAVLTVTTTSKEDATVTLGTVPTSKTYGDSAFTLTAAAANTGANGGWTWTSSNTSVLTVTDAGVVTVVGAGSANITATYESDTTLGSATSASITVGKATVTVAAKNQSIYVGETVPDLTNPVKDTHYTVTGLAGSDALTGTLVLAYEKSGSPATPDNTTTGTYDIVVSGVTEPNANYNAIVLTNGTLTISTKPSGGGGTPTVTVPVSGDAGSVNVKVTVSGTTASVDTVTAADLKKVVNAATEPVNVVIDMTGLGKTIDAATLTNSTLKAIADAANEDGSGITGLEVKLSGGTVVLEDKPLAAIQEQAGSDSVTLAVKPAAVADLNVKQKPVVEKLKAPAVFDVYFLVGSKRVESLSGGKIKITVPYVLTKGAVVVNYVDDAGKLEKLACTYDTATKAVSFETTHNSYYVISADADPCVNFTDINRDLWYHGAIDYAIENSLMNGVGGGKFNPNGNLSRAMLCQIFYNKEGRPAVTAENPFTDVPADQWYTDAVIWAYENKIVEGYDNGKFGPNDDITREQLAAIIWRYDGKKDSAASLDAFSDAGKISNYALGALKWAVENKVVSGKGGGILDPRGKATRAEVAQMLMNYLKK